MRLFVYRRAGVVVVDGDRVLLCSLEPPGQRRWWHFPGGGIEEGETPREAARRELFEETGLRARAMHDYVDAGIHGGEHRYFLAECDDLELGEVTGPELEYAAGQDFRAEWVPIADLARMPVFPRCIAEHVAAVGAVAADTSGVPWLEDDRGSWDGIQGEAPPPNVRFSARAFIAHDRRIAAIERHREGDHYFTLPGGGLIDSESPEEAVVREVREELGLDVIATGRLAVVVVRFGATDRNAVQTYIACSVDGGEFGSGEGEEYTEARRLARGTYRPVWLEPEALPASLKPAWLADRIPRWLSEPAPPRPERFCEFYD